MEKELQQKILTYRLLEDRLRELLKQREFIMNKMLELQATKDSIDDIKNSESMIFPIGSEAHAYGKIINKNKLIVEVGAGICLEKSFEEAKDILSKRIEEMQNVLTNLQRDVEQNISALDHLRPEINSSQEYSQAD